MRVTNGVRLPKEFTDNAGAGTNKMATPRKLMPATESRLCNLSHAFLSRVARRENFGIIQKKKLYTFLPTKTAPKRC
jgi:hypothetical protein